jgi:hypothetical protein
MLAGLEISREDINGAYIMDMNDEDIMILKHDSSAPDAVNKTLAILNAFTGGKTLNMNFNIQSTGESEDESEYELE